MHGEIIRILLVEDNPGDARLVREMLKDAASDRLIPNSFELTHARRLSEAMQFSGDGSFDVILLDLDLPDSRGLATFSLLHAKALDVPVVVLTGLADEAAGVKAVQEGAQDYLVKGVDANILVRAIRFAIERQRSPKAPGRAGAENHTHRKQGNGAWFSAEMVGESPALKRVLEHISTVAQTSRTSVLIHGETGTGKELIANSIHYLSGRRDGPFIKINCSAIPDTLLETEMFGYEKGAFTDARQSKKGLFELADGGTIFLDEIGDMDVRLQPKLLQILENRTFRKIGGIRDIQVDVRVVAATNKDLEAMVREKRFREDLYYRLKVMVINVPPLRERKEDIAPLAEYFIRESCKAAGVCIKKLSDDGREVLLRYPWPGNARELKNTIERAVLLTRSDEIQSEHLPQTPRAQSHGAHPAEGFFSSCELSLEELERSYIKHVLDKFNGNKTKAAEHLGISRLTLREKLKKDSIEELD